MPENQIISVIKPLLSQTLGILKSHWLTLGSIVLLTYVPMNIFMEWYQATHGINSIEDLLPVYRFAGVYELLLGSFAYVLIVYLTIAAMKNEKAGFTDIWKKFTGTAYVRVIWTRIVGGVLTSLLFLLLIVPGIIFSIFWIFSDVIAVVEPLGGWAALKKSKEMVKGRWWKVLLTVFVGFVCTVVLSNILSLGLSTFGSNWAIGLVSSFITDLGAALFVVYLTLAYSKLSNQ